MVNPLLVMAGADLFKVVGAFAIDMLNHEEEKREKYERREQERDESRREREREERREREREERQEREREEGRREREREEHRVQEQRNENRQAAEWRDEIKKRHEELDREGRAREDRNREARREQERWHAKMQAQRDADHQATMKRQEEEQERERRDRMEADRRRDREADLLKQYVKYCIQEFSKLMQQQQRPFRTLENSSEHKSYEKLSNPYRVEDPEDSDDDQQLVISMFNTSLLQGSSAQSSDPSQSFELLEFLDQRTADFEEQIYMVLANIKGATHDEAKEEGNAYFKDQKFGEAIKCYTRCIDQAPTAIVYANRGLAYLSIDKFIEAEEDCTEALKIDGYYVKAYAGRARARTKLGRLDGALKDVDVALQLEPMHQEMENLRAELKCLISKASASRRPYDHKKEDAIQAKEKGNAYFKDQKFDKAIKCYSESIDILPTGASYAHRAEAYLKLNKYAEVEEDCTEALKLDSKDFKVYARRAMVRRSLQHNLKGALTDVESALELEPADLEMKKLRAEIMNLI